MRFAPGLIVTIIICLACGCSRTNPEVYNQLDRAEAVVMTDADSAMQVLSDIKPTLLRGDDSQARFQLLTAMARYRLKITAIKRLTHSSA